MKRFLVLSLAAVALAFAACSQVGGGLTTPTLKQELVQKNSIVPSAQALTMSASSYCNAQSQVDYAALTRFCSGQSPQLPITLSTNYATASSQFSCDVYGYTGVVNGVAHQLIVPLDVKLGGCAATESGVTAKAPAPTPAPTPVA